jgi:hypothetical protein
MAMGRRKKRVRQEGLLTPTAALPAMISADEASRRRWSVLAMPIGDSATR